MSVVTQYLRHYFVSVTCIFRRQVQERYKAPINYALWEFDSGKKIIKTLEQQKFVFDSQVLDVGCGLGGIALAVAQVADVKSVVALDINRNFLKTALDLTQKKGLREHAFFVMGDAQQLPFQDQIFDSILSVDVVEHVKRPFSSLKEANRVLKNDKSMYISFLPFWGPFGGHLHDHLPIPYAGYIPKKMVRFLLQKLPKPVRNNSEKPSYSFFDLNKISSADMAEFIYKLEFKMEYQDFTYLNAFFKRIACLCSGWLADFLRGGCRLIVKKLPHC